MVVALATYLVMAKHVNVPNLGSNLGSNQQSPKINRWLLMALLIIIIDQITKYWFETNFLFGQRIQILPILDFILLYNKGAAFSFLAAAAGWQRWFFILIGVAAAILIYYLIRKYHQQPLFCAALGLILGGAIGNVIDRIVYGHVIDFILFYWNDWYFPAFNIADIAISCGAVLLIYDELLRIRKSKRSDS